MLAANPELEVWARLAATLDGKAHQLAYPLLIERDERIGRQDSLGRIGSKERGGVVARDAERGLGKVIGAEGEEFCALGDVAAAQRPPRQFGPHADIIG